MREQLDEIDGLIQERISLSEKILKIVETYIKNMIWEYDVSCGYSPDGCDTICVYIYNVHRNEVKKMKERIQDFAFDKVDKYGIRLLPMVKNVETTRKYYPEHYKE